MTGFGTDVFAQKIQTGFIHADNADGGEVIFPVKAGPIFDIPQIKPRIGIQVFVGK